MFLLRQMVRILVRGSLACNASSFFRGVVCHEQYTAKFM